MPVLSRYVTNVKSQLKNGLILYLALDDIGQNYSVDSSGNSHIASVVDTTYDGVQWVTGKRNKAVQFDGDIGSYLSVNATTLLSNKINRTIMLWMKSEHSSGNVYFLTFTNSSVGLLLANQVPKLVLGASNSKAFASAAAYLDGNLHHWCWTISTPVVGDQRGQNDIDLAKLYIDNVAIADSTVVKTGGISAWTTAHRFGGLGATFNSIVGTIDEVMIWNRVLTDAERTKVYQQRIYKKRRALPFL
jgi:hypothetical protein